MYKTFTYTYFYIMFKCRKGNEMNNSAKRVLTIKEAEKLFEGLTEYRIRMMCTSGELPCIKAGKNT